MMILDNFPNILWINLDKSTNRRDYMENLLKSHDLKNTRISAINGIDKSDYELFYFCKKNNSIQTVENACTASHFKALKYFVEETTDNRIIIFEDDVSFEFLEYIPYNWSEFEKSLPEIYDVIQLAIYSDYDIEHTLVKFSPERKYYCTTAYMITRQAAVKLIDMYFSKILNKLDLSNKPFATADTALYSLPNTYSIPIFTYQGYDSTIHSSHLDSHINSKRRQLTKWKEQSINQ